MSGKIFRLRLRKGIPSILATIGLVPTALAHPIPDVPVNSSFTSSGEVTIQIELDLRCLDEDPENARYILARELDSFTQEEREDLQRDAKAFLPARIEFEFKPGGKVVPEFEVEFLTKAGEELEQSDDVLFLRAHATFRVPDGADSYRIHAIKRGDLTVYFFNELAGVPVNRFQALFPGETSYWLDLRKGALQSVTPSTSNANVPPKENRALIIMAALLALAGAGWMIRRVTARA